MRLFRDTLLTIEPLKREDFRMNFDHSYQPQKIEKKWQKIWEEKKTFKTLNPGDPGFDPSKKPFYVLDMFPYPSGSGLHVGHALGYIGTDIIARKKRMEGYNVLHPMGWDAFGLPAEQYAIETGQHPRTTTDINTKNFRSQLKNLGLSYDWDREIDTSDPHYYKWTQWIFLQLYKKGTVYQKEMAVWWCEELKTVLANEEVINGRSERGNHPCERRLLKQWVFKITAYAERLLEDLKELDWPASIKKQQEDWIGKSIGAEVVYKIDHSDSSLKVFTTRPDTLFGVVALVLAPEHPLVQSLTTESCRVEVENYVKKSAAKSERDRKAEAEQLTGVALGSFGVHPLSGKKIPIYIADYVLADYGTGAVMVVPAHDERDFKFAKNVGLKFSAVIQENEDHELTEARFGIEGRLVNSGEFNGLASEEARRKIIEKLRKENLGFEKISYKIRDWIFSRQRYWGEPFPLLIDESGGIELCDESELPIELPPMKDFKPGADGSSPLARVPEWYQVQKSNKKYQRVTDTMPGWAGSCWYYLRFMDPLNQKEAFSKAAINYWKQVDLYVGGASHAVMHLLYARFWHKVLFDLGIVPTPEPFKKLFNQGMVTAFGYKDMTGRLVPSDDVATNAEGVPVRKSTGEKVEKFVTKMAKSLKNVVNPDDVVRDRGCDVMRLYEMFMGPLADEKPWDTDGLIGSEKFLRRLWNFLVDEQSGNLKASAEKNLQNEKSIMKCLKRVNDSFEHFNFNTSVAALMECLNDIQGNKTQLSREQIQMLMQILYPLAPHFASEVWEKLQIAKAIDSFPWPKLDESLLVEKEFEFVLQVNGKIKKRISAPIGMSEADGLRMAEENLSEFLSQVVVIKKIFVANKLANFVVKPN